MQLEQVGHVQLQSKENPQEMQQSKEATGSRRTLALSFQRKAEMQGNISPDGFGASLSEDAFAHPQVCLHHLRVNTGIRDQSDSSGSHQLSTQQP